METLVVLQLIHVSTFLHGFWKKSCKPPPFQESGTPTPKNPCLPIMISVDGSEILAHHLGYINPVNKWDKLYPTSTGEFTGLLNHQTVVDPSTESTQNNHTSTALLTVATSTILWLSPQSHLRYPDQKFFIEPASLLMLQWIFHSRHLVKRDLNLPGKLTIHQKPEISTTKYKRHYYWRFQYPTQWRLGL